MADELEPIAAPRIPSTAERGFDALLSVQRPVVLAHIRSIRSRRPDATPTQIIAILERRYLTAVTTGGALVGASAAIPAVGIATSVVLSGVETAGFLEATALFAQSVTEIHGIAVVDRERARTLVMTMMLGNGGQDLIRQFAGQVAGGSQTRSAFWGELVTKSLPSAAFASVADRVQKMFVRKFAVSQGSSVVGRMIPFGIGAVVGGGGNHLLGRRVVNSSRTAFGPAPAAFPESLDAVVKPPKAPRAPKAVKPPKKPKELATPKQPKAPKPKALPRGRDKFPMLPPAS
ncbi:hypothetical protein [Pseudolysinimonas sp.]|jgi:hypothetical protein|uniref:hypothetical protein n=1 Tax=Pseudolysinimonas sp. TaxID=2680009 RepID=UPI003784A401